MLQEIEGSHCKFADDGTLWHRGNDLNSLAQKISNDIQIVHEWCYKWRRKLSFPKTEVTLFHVRPMQEQFHDIFTIGNAILHYNPTPKILGITLDEQLNVSAHVNITEKKASRALHVIREVKGIARMSTRNLIRLYVSMVRPILEYGCTV